MRTGKMIMEMKFFRLALLAVLLVFATTAQAQIQIGGNVFGGGRMADVDGTSTVTVNGQASAATTINRVFGGNDIAGSVSGLAGSTVVIGSASCSTNAIDIKAVYGGGNGFYTYPGGVTVNDNNGITSAKTVGFTAGQVEFLDGTEAEASAPAGLVPQISQTHVTVQGAAVIDTLFGGAKNAFVNNSCAAAATIVVENGTIGHLYGGNNVGGAIPGNISITVNGTKVLNPFANADYANIGKTFGIYELYGGGNAVEAPGVVAVNINGGLIDQCFAGGNSATVGTGTCSEVHNSTTVTVNVPTATYTAGTDYDGLSGLYNVRKLFGGNNHAAMDIVPNLTLTQGGIGTVYGGGNQGEMTGSLDINGHAVSTNIQLASGSTIKIDNIYGGGMMAGVSNGTNINLAADNDAQVGNVYGGCNISGDVGGDGSFIALADGTVQRAVFGGANGAYGCNNGSAYMAGALDPDGKDLQGVPIPTIKNTHVYVEGVASIAGNIYGGGNMAPVGKDAEGEYGSTEVKLVSGSVAGYAFGGGNMASVYGYANIYTPENSTITIAKVFGGNDRSGEVTGDGISGTASDGTELNKSIAASYVKIQGQPHITDVYGAGYGRYTADQYAAMGCGLEAPVQKSSFVDLNLSAGTGSIDHSYGGGYAAEVNGTATTVVNSLGGTIGDVYGANDYAGDVDQANVYLKGSTDSKVNNVYGGGNGNYAYTDGFSVPNANQTFVELAGGSVQENIYGGGYAGDVFNTNVHVTDQTKLADTTQIYGGGCGNVAEIGKCVDASTKHVGNVSGTATLVVESLQDPISTIYGGGRNGDVNNASVTIANTVTQQIGTLYGGCMASDLTGTTTITLGTKDVASTYPNINIVYGGNDYSGLTQNTVLTVNSGTYRNVFGAGNGVYDYYKDSRLSGFTCKDTVPYSMNVDLTFNGGTFIDHVYGGGNMGLVGDKHMAQAKHPEGGTGTENFDMYGYIHMKIHDGTFQNRVFAGACGTAIGEKRFFGQPSNGSTVLAYAYKQVDMDGGNVRFSLHGGSEGVDDGFPYECKGNEMTNNHATNSTLRPSSVVNIVGGTVEKSLYGGGYEGSTYGSIYVNVGLQAVLSSPVWTKSFGRYNTATSSQVNPWTFESDDKMVYYYNQARQLFKEKPLYLRASIYNGSDWGDAGTSQYFDTRGFYGGVGLVYVDGQGYQTSRTRVTTDPQLEITNSLFGSGTSTAPADINSQIWLYNYGDFSCPHPSRNLFSIQRTNNLTLFNSYILLSGESDAYYAHTSGVRSFNRIDTIVFHQKNLVETAAESEYIGMIISEDEFGSGNGIDHLYTRDNLYDISDDTHCDKETQIGPCDVIHGNVLNRNTLILDGGSYLSVRPFKDKRTNGSSQTDANGTPDHIDDGDGDYGPILGYLFVQAQQSTLASVTARERDMKTGEILNPNDGGFVAPCAGANGAAGRELGDNGEDWEHEREYVNMHSGDYVDRPHRSWSIGTPQGERRRKITLVAHANPDRVDENKHIGTLTDGHYTFTADGNGYSGFAYTTASLILPPADGGNFYTIQSVSIDDDNGGQVELRDWAFEPTSEGASTGTWWSPYATDAAVTEKKESLDAIAGDPSYTFGLMFKQHDYFASTDDGSVTNPQAKTVISGNNILTGTNGFTSYPIISGAKGVLPSIDFTLVYNTNMETTIARDVVFNMMEYKMVNGVKTEVGPIEVTVTISTIISDFDDMHPTVLAMYNEGEYHKYVRKVVIPASFEERDLYITGVEWKYSDLPGSVPPVDYRNDFHLQDTSSTLPDTYDKFYLSITPSQKVTENISNTLGWYDIAHTNIDIHKLHTLAGAYQPEAGTADADNEHSRWNLADPIKVGTLDGRATAAFDITLFFNGNLMYKDVNDLGHVKLYMKYINKKEVGGDRPEGTFVIDTKVWSRAGGDTIYMASPAMMTLAADGTITHYNSVDAPTTGTIVSTLYRYDNPDLTKYEKNDPLVYFNSFKKALNKKVYKEGDVICIMDSIHIDDPNNPFGIQGSAYGNINIVRYSGSHPRWPDEICSYRGPLIIVENGAKLTISNARLDGKGCSRIAGKTVVGTVPNGHWNTLGNGNETTPIAGQGYMITAKAGEVYLNGPSAGQYYQYTYSTRNIDPDTTIAHSPVILVKDNSQLRMNTNVKIYNNFNLYDFAAYGARTPDDFYSMGGAIGLQRTPNGSPTLALGDMIYYYDNLILDGNHSVTDASVASCEGDPHSHTYVLPGNYGGAVYVNGGNMSVGVLSKDNIIELTQNYYIPTPGADFLAATTADLSKYLSLEHHQYTDINRGNVTVSYDLYAPNTSYAHLYYKPNNVYLTRTADATDKVTKDGQSTSIISVNNQLSADSKISVSKWFPGFKWRDDCIGRDTISIASYANAGSLAAAANFASGVWRDDSASTNHVVFRDYDDAPYSTANANTPNNEDVVDVLYSTLLNYYNVYLHRCATFTKAAANPIAWEMDESVVCPGDGDRIKFSVDGGQAAFTYNWYVKPDGWTEPTGSQEVSTATGLLTDANLQENQVDGNRYWTSTATNPQVSIAANADIIGKDFSIFKSGEFGSSDFSISVPSGYLITGVSFDYVSSSEGGHLGDNLVRDDGTSIFDRGESGHYATDSPLNTRVVKFKIKGDNHGVSLTNIVINTKQMWPERVAQQVTVDRTGTYHPLGLELDPGQAEKTYHLRVEATDAGNLCSAEHFVDLHLIQTGADDASGDPEAKVQYFTETKTAKSKTLDQWLGNTGVSGYWNGNAGTWSVASNSTPFVVPSVEVNKNPAGTESDPTKVVRVYTYKKINWAVEPQNTANPSQPYATISASSDNAPSLTMDSRLCPGDVINLSVGNINSNYEFMMWDYDPSASETLTYVVGNQDNEKLTAFLSPKNDYWYKYVTSAANGASDDDHIAGSNSFTVDYHGNVDIYDEKGLAWLISTVNGFNYQAHRTYIYDTITIHPKDGGYDMSAHLWTPIGDLREPFRGTINVADGTGSAEIKGLIVNEKELQYVGMFGQTDSARISGLHLSGSVIRGTFYGGGLVGYAGPNSDIHDITLEDMTVSAANMVGGLAGKTDGARVQNVTVGTDEHPIKLVGTSLYAGGVAGLSLNEMTNGDPTNDPVPGNNDNGPAPAGKSVNTQNNVVKIDGTMLSSLYFGGLFGGIDHEGQPNALRPARRRGAKVAGDNQSHIHNNYVQINSGDRSLYVGGLFGTASHTDLQNNYVYGRVSSISSNGALIGRVGEDVDVANCYYLGSTADRAFGAPEPTSVINVTTFDGQGNQVLTAQNIGGIDNMTRILNKWVRTHENTGYKTWRSDLEGVNGGFPVFGTPDQVPVYSTVHEVVCDSMNLDGIIISESGVYKTIYSNLEEGVDSILTIVLTVNHADRVEYNDTVRMGEDYYGNGFMISAEQIAAMASPLAMTDVQVLQFVDSLLTEQGCDSVVVLNLSLFKGRLDADEAVRFEVNVYPNPTLGQVNVEADGLESVEVFDALSRQVRSVRGLNGKASFDLSGRASGSYYLRITTTHGTVVRKVVKK